MRKKRQTPKLREFIRAVAEVEAGIDWSPEAKQYLSELDEFEFHADPNNWPSLPRERKALVEVIMGLQDRYFMAFVFGFTLEHRERAKLKAACRDMRKGLLETKRVYSEDEKQRALELFSTLYADTNSIKLAAAGVKKLFGVSPKTLYNWRTK